MRFDKARARRFLAVYAALMAGLLILSPMILSGCGSAVLKGNVICPPQHIQEANRVEVIYLSEAGEKKYYTDFKRKPTDDGVQVSFEVKKSEIKSRLGIDRFGQNDRIRVKFERVLDPWVLLYESREGEEVAVDSQRVLSEYHHALNCDSVYNRFGVEPDKEGVVFAKRGTFLRMEEREFPLSTLKGTTVVELEIRSETTIDRHVCVKHYCESPLKPDSLQ